MNCLANSAPSRGATVAGARTKGDPPCSPQFGGRMLGEPGPKWKPVFAVRASEAVQEDSCITAFSRLYQCAH